MGLGLGIVNSREDEKLEADERDSALRDADEMEEKKDATDPPIQLDLLPLGPVPRNPPSSSQLCFPWPTKNGNTQCGQASTDISTFVLERASRANDEENGLTRKKLRLSKEQSAFLEETFKKHNTLNPVCRNPERERERKRERAGSLCYFLKEGGGGAPGQFPDGRRIQRNFLCKDPIQLWSFYYSHLEETGARQFRLVQAIPGDSKQLDYVTKLTFVEFGSPFLFSLEAGSKPKLLAMSCLCKGNPEIFLSAKVIKTRNTSRFL
ncbi:PREDICTED: plant UBX domain-containing protein 12-like [Nelumbo nucifera]|uniref:Plant UBX domain-containing protein 12-like n=1 Tax=Nelumbo nucifera TaxID=4432 RepID=A0A1U8B051_NELNU|nr:PREDICTED: plant UBX domain-containing protein 12-like [Nelumbo nucifera]